MAGCSASAARPSRPWSPRLQKSRWSQRAPAVSETLTTPVAPTPEIAAPEPQRSWWQRLKSGLSRSSGALGQGIVDVFTKRKLDAAALEDLEDMLLRADLGMPAATRIIDQLSLGRFDREIEPGEIRQVLAREIEGSLTKVARPLVIDTTARPFVILVVGVNGSGKTTTIAKLTAKFRDEGRSVMLAAGDTFRAAAVEQLKIWGGRLGVEVVSRDAGADAAGLAFDAVTAAREGRRRHPADGHGRPFAEPHRTDGRA